MSEYSHVGEDYFYGYTFKEVLGIFVDGDCKNNNKNNPKIGNIMGIKFIIGCFSYILSFYTLATSYILKISKYTIPDNPDISCPEIIKIYNDKKTNLCMRILHFAYGKKLYNLFYMIAHMTLIILVLIFTMVVIIEFVSGFVIVIFELENFAFNDFLKLILLESLIGICILTFVVICYIILLMSLTICSFFLFTFGFFGILLSALIIKNKETRFARIFILLVKVFLSSMMSIGLFIFISICFLLYCLSIIIAILYLIVYCICLYLFAIHVEKEENTSYDTKIIV